MGVEIKGGKILRVRVVLRDEGEGFRGVTEREFEGWIDVGMSRGGWLIVYGRYRGMGEGDEDWYMFPREQVKRVRLLKGVNRLMGIDGEDKE